VAFKIWWQLLGLLVMVLLNQGGLMTQKKLATFILLIGILGGVHRGVAAVPQKPKNPSLAATMSSLAGDQDYIALVTKKAPALVKNEEIQVAIVRTKVIKFLFQTLRDDLQGERVMLPPKLASLSGAALSGMLLQEDKRLSDAQAQLEKIQDELTAQLKITNPAARNFKPVGSLLFELSGKDNKSSIKQQAHNEFIE
jgi:hypothetical protein